MGAARDEDEQASGVGGVICPKVVIISMFDLEANVWYQKRDELLTFTRKIAIPGLSPYYPHIQCTASGDVCQLTTGEALVNAALAVFSLTQSPLFDLTKSYFLIAGISGMNPKVGTLGSVMFSRFAVQVDLQYEFDSREIPADWSVGYVPLGASSPDEYPKILYGTEVFEINADLRKHVMSFTKDVPLADSAQAIKYRALFANAPNDVFKAATLAPSVAEGDSASSNVFFHGQLLAEGFEKVFRLFTNGLGNYSVTQQEDNATLGALLRATRQGKVDFGRIIIMRAGSNFDRSFSETRMPTIPLHANHGGLEPSLENIYRVGSKVIEGILDGWAETFEKGVPATNYIGDIFGSLGGNPSFGPGRKVLPQVSTE